MFRLSSGFSAWPVNSTDRGSTSRISPATLPSPAVRWTPTFPSWRIPWSDTFYTRGGPGSKFGRPLKRNSIGLTPALPGPRPACYAILRTDYGKGQHLKRWSTMSFAFTMKSAASIDPSFTIEPLRAWRWTLSLRRRATAGESFSGGCHRGQKSRAVGPFMG